MGNILSNIINNKESKHVCRRDSFDCRVTDYSCEILLSYLSFEDKIRFECISKQFKRLVFNKQKVFSDLGFNGLLQVWPELRSRNPNLIEFERILMKCKEISSIDIQCKAMTTEMTQIITKYCNNLNKIKVHLSEMDIEVVNSFGQKFGQSLTEVGFSYLLDNNQNQSHERSLVGFCPELKYITGIQFNHFIDKNNFKHFKNLSEINININNESDIELFDLFVNNYKNQLKSLEIVYEIDSDNEYMVNNRVINLFKSIATEFTQLTEFSFTIMAEMSDEFQNEMFAMISGMDKIEKLYLSTLEAINPEVLLHLHSLTQLIELNLEYLKVTDDFFTDIHKYLPKLKTLRISEFDIKITNQSLDSLSMLESLENINISFGDEEEDDEKDFTDEDFIQFINECKITRNIAMESKHEISDQTIETMISLALRKPELKFKFMFNFGANLQQFEENFPRNARFVSIH